MAREKQSLGRRLGSILGIMLALPFILAFGLPLAIIVIILRLLNRLAVYLLVWTLWLPKGNDVLVVLSDSPVWHDYMAAEILPLVDHRAVVLNWSERKRWRRWSLARHVFRTFKGNWNFNPLVLVFRPFRKAEVFRFWQPFQEWKHGHKESVEGLKRQLAATL